MKQKTLEALAREEKRDYARDWRARNPDKVREANKRYWERRARKRMEQEGEHERDQ